MNKKDSALLFALSLALYFGLTYLRAIGLLWAEIAYLPLEFVTLGICDIKEVSMCGEWNRSNIKLYNIIILYNSII